MTDYETVPAGKLICFSSGEYSDYGYEGHFLTLEPLGRDEFDIAKQNIRNRINDAGHWQEYEWDNAIPVDEMDNQDWGMALRGPFVCELIRMGKIMAIDCFVFHLGSYDRLDL